MSAEQATENFLEQKKPQLNFIKTRDDADIVVFEKTANDTFKLSTSNSCSWCGENGEFTQKELRPRIEPWLTSLFQSEHLTLLAGSGLTHAVHLLSTGEKATGMDKIEFSILAKKKLALLQKHQQPAQIVKKEILKIKFG